MIYRVLRSILFLFPPESSHFIALKLLKLGCFLKINLLLTKINHRNLVTVPHTVMSIDFPNILGLAAGLDKNGEYIDVFESLGFGFVEIGTITPRPQGGNSKPRLFRLPEKEAIINRMGFNNKGVDYLIDQVKKSKHEIPLGINIGKNFDTPIDRAIDDYLICFKKVYCYADYIVINISSPNTPDLRNLQHGDYLKSLLFELKVEQKKLSKEFNKYTPLVVKVAPDLEHDEIKDMAEVFLDIKIDGLITTNTTLDRSLVKGLKHSCEAGGVSGRPVFSRSLQTQKEFSKYLKSEIPIIAVGGITNVDSARKRIDSGSSLLQIYTGFIYQGPGLITNILKNIS